MGYHKGPYLVMGVLIIICFFLVRRLLLVWFAPTLWMNIVAYILACLAPFALFYVGAVVVILVGALLELWQEWREGKK
jgi:hypothetical protein